MTIHVHYATKKDLKAAVGQRLRYSETSVFGPEYVSTGTMAVCDPKHKWYAQVTMAEGKIAKVQ